MKTRKIIPYSMILITGFSLVRKINIFLWACKTGKMYILYARHTFPFAIYIFSSKRFLNFLFFKYVFK